ncbi:uncharacterized protein LOC121736319 isoform X2 [Aricia agestis]|uniref:uncharacterized protein LOC121736319 isoform X2 n=1 Tax=Aricia agestis TaxID=91739 RepID=UPI001C202452|nr:uncharacterized protein LOC121736319 isoform X2 [Aricia agestis]
MSVLNQSGEEQAECPLCMEPLEVDDLHFYPCTCGYQICRFCWNRIREGENGLCPACRKAYPENPADFTPLSQEQVAAIKTEKKAREQKRRNKTLESRRALANVRVVQNNLVFVVGLPVRLADAEILKRQEYFGKYGKIHKVVINQSTAYAGSQGPSASAYVTYVSSADALRAIQGVNNVTLDGRVLKGSLGTTKYCANFMKNQPCPKPDCMYLHELGDPKASFTKEEMHAGLHQVYERRLHQQLLQATRDRPERTDDRPPADGTSSTNSEKGSSKDGNGTQSNFIPTTVVTSSQINIVNTSRSKKDSVNSNSTSSSNSVNGKEAWPSLGSSPPTDSPARKQTSPKPIQTQVKAHENGTSESSSPPQQSQSKNTKEHTESKPNRSNKDNSITNGQTSKKNKSDSKQKQKNSNSISNEASDVETTHDKLENGMQVQHSSVFENDTQQSYLSNELDELESDRHSLLENHDLLDNSDHSLLDDDNTHNLLNDANNEVMMMQRHREMLAGLVDNNHLLPHNIKSPLANGYGLLDRDSMSYLSNDRQISQINQSLMEQKEMLLRERNRSSLLMRQNEMLNRQHNVMVEPKHYMPTSSIGLDASELLGANYHPNHNMLPPFGMRIDNSMAAGLANTMSNNLTNTMSVNSLSANPISNPMINNMSNMSNMTNMTNSMGVNALGDYMLHNQMQMQNQQMQSGLMNGFDNAQAVSEGRYQAETMDKFFTDFHKAQQLRLSRDRPPPPREYPHMLHADRLEMEHKSRMNNMRGGESLRASGDGDDDLDFDPFKETQKALAEMMETEMMMNHVSSDSVDRRRARLPPPGFAHMAGFGAAPPQPMPHHQGYNTNSAMYSDWTQMDPAIMSTSVNFGKPPAPAAPAPATLSQQQQELFARFNQLGLQGPKPQWAPPPKAPWPLPPYNSIPLPPGFAPAGASQHPAECIDAK